MKRLLILFIAIIAIGVNKVMSQCAVVFIKPECLNLIIPNAAYCLEYNDIISECENVRKPHILNISTQPLILAVGIPNIEADLQLSAKLSISLNIGYAPWFISSKFSPRSLFIFPEIRYWVKSYGSGLFAGIHMNTAWYNLRLGKYRYQDTNSPALGGGFTFGYQYKLSETFSLRFDLGAGYTYLKYDRYHNDDYGERIDVRKTSYFGIDRFSIALAYSIPL